MASRRPSRWRRLLPIFLLFLLMMGGWGGWRGVMALMDSDFLSTRYIEVSGCRVLPEEMVRELLEPQLGTPLLRLPMDSLRMEIAALPRVSSVELDRRLPGTLSCRIEEALPVALLMEDDGFCELDGKGRRLERFGPAPPDLPILVPGAGGGTDSLILLGCQLLRELELQSFDINREVSEIRLESRGLIYRRNEGETRVLLGWEDIPARVAAYRQVQPLLAQENSFPMELDLRYRDQVIARDSLELK